MTEKQLRKKMQKYHKLAIKLRELEAEIQGAVLQTGKTQQFGQVAAKYLEEERIYDYKRGLQGKQIPEKALRIATSPNPDTVSYKALCEYLNIPMSDIPRTIVPAKVVVGILDE